MMGRIMLARRHTLLVRGVNRARVLMSIVDVGWAGMGQKRKRLLAFDPVINQHVGRGTE